MNSKQIKCYEEIIDKYQDRLVKYAFFRIGSYEDAQDIVQNVFIKFFEKKINFGLFNNPKSYLFQSISNACIDFYRSNNRFNTVSLENVQEINSIKDTDYINLIEEYKRIKSVLKILPEEQSEVVHLRAIDDLSFIEIAKILNIPVSTVKSRFKYGIDKLKLNYKEKLEVNYEL